MATLDQHNAAPPQPKSVLRGHKAQIHAVAFLRSNERLLTGDADGFVVAWDLTIMRPRAVWQAHGNAILGIAAWGLDKIITHGRDNRLIVWQLSVDDEPAMSTILPLHLVTAPRPKPWMLHLLHVNTMNFCSFASCPASAPTPALSPSLSQHSPDLLVAVPNTLALEAVDIYHLPSQDRIHTVKLGGDHGMPMSLALAWLVSTLTLIVAYEDGTAIVAWLENDGSWVEVYRSHCHTQPILSLHVAPDLEYFLTSGADATIAKHPLLSRHSALHNVADAGLQTAVPTCQQHSQGAPEDERACLDNNKAKATSLLSDALASQSAVTLLKAPGKPEILTQPLKIISTKHSGQQGLTIRSDGRIFATAGWDSRIRVYSAKSMREVAVLKWHPVGCFAVAFADVPANEMGNIKPTAFQADGTDRPAETRLVSKVFDVAVRDKRLLGVKKAHWLAAGSKDGKVTLWDIF